MRTLRGRTSINENKLASKEEPLEKKPFDDDVGADGDETTDDEGAIDTPPPPKDEEDSKGDAKEEEPSNERSKGKQKKLKKISKSKVKDQEIDNSISKENSENDSRDNPVNGSKDVPATKDSKKRPKRKSIEEADLQEADDEYEVEQIVDMETKQRWKCPVRFRVRWVGYGEKDDSWLPASELYCNDLVNEFLEISGRKPEYERAMEAKKDNAGNYVDGLRQSSRHTSKVSYSELDEDEDEILPSGTKSRKIRKKGEEFYPQSSQKRKAKKKNTPRIAAPKAQSSYEEECEVHAIAGMREINGYPEYKIRWKGHGPKYDSWVKEEELNCPVLLNNFKATLEKLEKQEDWQVESILKVREKRGKKEFLIHWKGFDSKCDSWEPEENIEGCKNIVEEFLDKEEREREKMLKSKRTRDKEERARPERFVENYSEGMRARSKRSKLNVSYTEDAVED